MAGTTPNRDYWYPDGDDPISAGDDGLRSLAADLDADITALADEVTYATTVSVPVTNSVIGANTVVTFPAGTFAAVPVVSVSSSGTSWFMAYIPFQPTQDNVQVNVRRIDGQPQTIDIPVQVIAVGPRGNPLARDAND